MAVVVYARLGGATCSAVLANGIAPMIGFFLGLSAVYLMSIPYGSMLALLVALVLSVGFTLGLALLRPYIRIYNNVRVIAGE